MRRYTAPGKTRERPQPNEQERKRIVKVLMEEGYTKEEAKYMAGTVGDIRRPEGAVE